MALTGKVPDHPAQFSPEIVSYFREHLPIEPLHIHDPCAGLGVRMAALAAELGHTFTGTDLEPWPTRHDRVRVGDATDPTTYPRHDRLAIITSPVYFGNRISSDYVEGPLPTTNTAGRRAYGISRGEPLHPDNAARFCRPSQLVEYLDIHDRILKAAATANPMLVIINVDVPMLTHFQDLMVDNGFPPQRPDYVATRRYRIGSDDPNDPKSIRADHEVMLTWQRNLTPRCVL